MTTFWEAFIFKISKDQRNRELREISFEYISKKHEKSEKCHFLEYIIEANLLKFPLL